MADFLRRTTLCSVLFIDIADFSLGSVDGQLRAKGLLSRSVTSLVAKDSAARSGPIVLDTGDGAAVCYFDDPEDALFAAIAIRHKIENTILLRSGINLGPVKRVDDVNGQPNLVGDGINAAQRIMSFAEPGELLISESYYQAVSRIRERQIYGFRPLGVKLDKHGREHRVYALMPRGEGAAWTPSTDTQVSATRLTAGAAPVTEAEIHETGRLLMRFLGPAGLPAAKRAARQHRSREAFFAATSGFLADEADRAAFLKVLGERTGHVAGPGGSLAGGSGGPTPNWPPPADEIHSLERRLVVEIGPIAPVVIKKALARCETRDALYAELAGYLREGPSRERFLREMGEPET